MDFCCSCVVMDVCRSADLFLIWVDEGVHFHCCAEDEKFENVEKAKLLEKWFCWGIWWLAAKKTDDFLLGAV